MSLPQKVAELADGFDVRPVPEDSPATACIAYPECVQYGTKGTISRPSRSQCQRLVRRHPGCIAVLWGQAKMAEVLVKAVADRSAHNNKQLTPLGCAKQERKHAVAHFIGDESGSAKVNANCRIFGLPSDSDSLDKGRVCPQH